MISTPLAAPTTANRRESGGTTYDGGALENGANDPNPTGDDDRPLAADDIGELGDCQCPEEGASRHGGDDSTLRRGARVVERPLVGVVGEDAGHGRNVQTEETTADTCERAYDVGVRRDAWTVLWKEVSASWSYRYECKGRGHTLFPILTACLLAWPRERCRSKGRGGEERRTQSRGNRALALCAHFIAASPVMPVQCNGIRLPIYTTPSVGPSVVEQCEC